MNYVLFDNMKQLHYVDLAAFISDRIEDYEERVQLALNLIDHNRCSLQQADSILYSQMYDAVCEYVSDNDLDIDLDEIDLETVLFTEPCR